MLLLLWSANDAIGVPVLALYGSYDGSNLPKAMACSLGDAYIPVGNNGTLIKYSNSAFSTQTGLN